MRLSGVGSLYPAARECVKWTGLNPYEPCLPPEDAPRGENDKEGIDGAGLEKSPVSLPLCMGHAARWSVSIWQRVKGRGNAFLSEMRYHV